MAARGFGKVQEATASNVANSIKTTGGHGGPPLQYVLCWLIPGEFFDLVGQRGDGEGGGGFVARRYFDCL